MSKWDNGWDGFSGYRGNHWHQHGFHWMPLVGFLLLGLFLMGPIFALFGLVIRLGFAMLPFLLIGGLIWFAVKGMRAEFGAPRHAWNRDWSPKPKNDDRDTFYI